MWGSPIEHSLSPVLHQAAYAALGLSDWSYERREVDAAGFPAALAELGPQWRGLSLTMPLKEVALTAAAEVSATAAETGVVNTLVRKRDGWVGHNTDVHGIVAALAEAGCESADRALVVGSGATARSALRALEELGTRRVALMVRSVPRPEALAQAERAGLRVEVVRMGEWAPADVVISTVPPAGLPALDHFPSPVAGSDCGVVLDVVYGEGRTPVQTAALAHGWALAPGTDMLLHQAAEQVRLMTGLEPPIEVMRAALARSGAGSVE